MALPADQRCKQALFGPRESRHVRMLGDVRTVALVTLVRDIESDFVKTCSPVQYIAGDPAGKSPLILALRIKIGRCTSNAFCLLLVYLVARFHCPNRPLASILVL